MYIRSVLRMLRKNQAGTSVFKYLFRCWGSRVVPRLQHLVLGKEGLSTPAHQLNHNLFVTVCTWCLAL